MKDILNHLYSKNVLESAQAKAVLIGIAQGRYNACQVAAFLSVYRMRQVAVEELVGFRQAMLELALPLDLSPYRTIDLCGTGGDGKNTFNISTVTAFIVAGAGVKVAKHGNYGASSNIGSSNLIEALKIPFPSTEAQARSMLERAGIAFLHAPLWHPAMKNVAPIRKDLGVRTLFNILGPLANPARPAFQLVGVPSRDLVELYSSTLRRGDTRYAVVYSTGGFDEISLTSETIVATTAGEEAIQSSSFGLHTWQEDDIKGGATVSEAAKICLDILHNRGSAAQEEVVIANAALALSLVHAEKQLCNREALSNYTAQARESLRSQRALKALTTLQEMHP